MRRGELPGLQWGDIDFAGQFIEVRRAVVRRQVTSTKTHKIRRVDMSPQLSGTLKALKEIRFLEASLKGTTLPEWVFLTLHGHRMTIEVLQKAFYACLDGADIRRVRFHDCRHTYASLLIQQGANVKYIQQQLGHGSISITLDIYSHLFQGDHRHQVHRLDDPQDEMAGLTASKRESATQAQPSELAKQDAITQGVDILDKYNAEG
jgi:integrase